MVNVHSLGTSTDWIIMLSYFVIIMLFGSYFGKYNRNTHDFFFGGRRFAWWLIAFSIVATGIGSHSFIKYSAKGFEYGFSSTMTYLNDWFFMPFFMFGWLPIIVYTKIQSIPEYFEKRFSPITRLIATIFLLLYMVGYVGIGFLTMGKALLPMLPESFSLLGIEFQTTLMGLIIVIAIITGIYITFGGQTAVIFTDLLQGIILLFAGFLIFFLGIDYVGGTKIFWDLLPVSWKLPLANFNTPSDFNFVGIFWQDGIAGSVGFLFMNMGLVMRFMATKSVDEGRKAAVFNILFMLPLSAIVVGNAGWIGKAISVTNPELVGPQSNPDSIFVIVANIISQPGVFGFIMAALTAALMSTVDTLINATAAVFLNDVYRPFKKIFKFEKKSAVKNDKEELLVARLASVLFTMIGVLAVIPFSTFPTVYEAHGFFHATLTPPLVTAIFLGVFWKKFTPAAVMATFIGGASFMILGSYYPAVLIKPIAQGTPFDLAHPYSYISALYNIIVCVGVGVIAVYTTSFQKNIVAKIKNLQNSKTIMTSVLILILILFIIIFFNLLPISLLLLSAVSVTFLVVIASEHYIKYDSTINTTGLTIWSLAKAKELFKGSKVNIEEGKKVKVNWKLKEIEDNRLNFSKNEMELMKANIGDLVYLSDARKYLGGLKSIHSVYGEPHNENGIVYFGNEALLNGVFEKDRILIAEKEM
jgi:SSS family solute:Na+ symporter